jgi:hypothetical protein
LFLNHQDHPREFDTLIIPFFFKETFSVASLKVGVFLAGTGHHVASWRHPKAQANGSINLSYFQKLAQTA